MKLQISPLICETEPSEMQFPNGSDHTMIACYLELYEEDEVEHISGLTHAPTPYHQTMLAVAKAKGNSTRLLL